MFFEFADGESDEDDEEFLPDVETNDLVEEIHSLGESNLAQLQGFRQELTEKIENLKGEFNEKTESLREEVHESNQLLRQLLSDLGLVFRLPSSRLPTS